MADVVKKLDFGNDPEYLKNKIESLENQIEYFEKLIPDSVVKLNQSLTDRVEALLVERGGLLAKISDLDDKLKTEKKAHENGRKVQAGLVQSARSDIEALNYRNQSLENELRRLNKKISDLETERSEMQLKLESRETEIELLNEIKSASRDDEVVSKIERLTEMVEGQSLQIIESIKECLRGELSSGMWSDVVDILEKNKSYLIKSGAGKIVKKDNEKLKRDFEICECILAGALNKEIADKFFAGNASPAVSASQARKRLTDSGVLAVVDLWKQGKLKTTEGFNPKQVEMIEYIELN